MFKLFFVKVLTEILCSNCSIIILICEIPMFTRSVIAYQPIDRFLKANQIWKCIICSFYIILEFWINIYLLSELKKIYPFYVSIGVLCFISACLHIYQTLFQIVENCNWRRTHALAQYNIKSFINENLWSNQIHIDSIIIRTQHAIRIFPMQMIGTCCCLFGSKQ